MVWLCFIRGTSLNFWKIVKKSLFIEKWEVVLRKAVEKWSKCQGFVLEVGQWPHKGPLSPIFLKICFLFLLLKLFFSFPVAAHNFICSLSLRFEGFQYSTESEVHNVHSHRIPCLVLHAIIQMHTDDAPMEAPLPSPNKNYAHLRINDWLNATSSLFFRRNPSYSLAFPYPKSESSLFNHYPFYCYRSTRI